jgi:hypothetical protein
MADFPTDLSEVADNVDDVMAKHINNIEAKLGVDSSTVTTSHDYKITNLETGWINPGEDWAYASANTITVPSGAASKYQKGDRIKWTQTTVKYGVITAVTNTVLTIAVNTDYVVTNAPISDNFYSHQENPMGYPGWFTFIPTMNGTGGSAGSYAQTVQSARFNVKGRSCTVAVSFKVTNIGSWTGDIRFVLPIATTISNDKIYHNLWIQTNGVPIAAAKAGFSGASTASIKAITSFQAAAGAWGTNIANNDYVWGVFDYEI